MAILSPLLDVGETLLTTLATSVVGNTAEPIVEVDVKYSIPWKGMSLQMALNRTDDYSGSSQAPQ